jgi:hypothetical protein
MTDPLAESMADMAINKKHWKYLKFNENFLAETGGRGIPEFLYAGYAGAYGTHDYGLDREHATTKCFWHLTHAQHGL